MLENSFNEREIEMDVSIICTSLIIVSLINQYSVSFDRSLNLEKYR